MPPWEDVSDLKSVISWGHWYQWGDAIDVRGDADSKRLGTPVIKDGIHSLQCQCTFLKSNSNE